MKSCWAPGPLQRIDTLLFAGAVVGAVSVASAAPADAAYSSDTIDIASTIVRMLGPELQRARLQASGLRNDLVRDRQPFADEPTRVAWVDHLLHLEARQRTDR